MRTKPIVLSRKRFNHFYPTEELVADSNSVWEKARTLLEDDMVFVSTITYILNSEWRKRTTPNHYS